MREASGMLDKERLDRDIEAAIARWFGTPSWYGLRNMWENGCGYEEICNLLEIDLSEYEK